ncbi:hypothetical protein F4774DRAFT_374716 [Daldinia eschscholtzii]|nr:hypothetical protein F4774DRAFT_374716 [Daldinia eschscholtzii]
MSIPYQTYSNSKFEGQKYTFDIIRQYWGDGDLSVYVVHHGGQLFEAQVFAKSRLPFKIYLSRKRRIQRLRRSDNYVDELESDYAKIIISCIPADGIMRHCKTPLTAINEGIIQDLSADSYPPLCPSTGASVQNYLEGTCLCNHPRSFAEVASSPTTQKQDLYQSHLSSKRTLYLPRTSQQRNNYSSINED